MSLRSVLLGLAAAAFLWSCGQAPGDGRFTFTITPRPKAIDDRGQQTTITVSVFDAQQKPRGGKVTLTADAGQFADGGKEASFELDAMGQGIVKWSCDKALDALCMHDVRIEVRWEQGTEFLVDVLRITVGSAVDGGMNNNNNMNQNGGGPDLSGNKVLLVGTLGPGLCFLDGVADPTEPTKVKLGFPCYRDQPALYAGSIYYIGAGRMLMKWGEDSPEWWNKAYIYPQTPTTNDTKVATTGCAMGTLDSYLLGPDGQLFYRCSSSTGPAFLDGNPSPYPSTMVVLALGHNGEALLAGGSTGYAIGKSDGSTIDLTGLPTEPLLAARSDEMGFKMAFGSLTKADSLYLALRDGSTQKLGDYPPFPPGKTQLRFGKMDSSGTLFAFNEYMQYQEEIIRLPLAPDTGAVIYSEANGFMSDWKTSPPKFYLMTDLRQLEGHASVLITGP